MLAPSLSLHTAFTSGIRDTSGGKNYLPKTHRSNHMGNGRYLFQTSHWQQMTPIKTGGIFPWNYLNICVHIYRCVYVYIICVWVYTYIIECVPTWLELSCAYKKNFVIMTASLFSSPNIQLGNSYWELSSIYYMSRNLDLSEYKEKKVFKLFTYLKKNVNRKKMALWILCGRGCQ